jgi:hypothetical protein
MSDELPLPRLELDADERQRRFDALQERLVPLWEAIESMDDEDERQTIVVVPSLTVEYTLVGSEIQAYEERYLFLLLLLRQPTARLVYVTSQEVNPAIVDYYLGLLPGLIISHARKRLFLVSPHDAGGQPLSVKLLQRPGLLERIRALIPDPRRAHLVPFNSTAYEQELALRLGIPMYAADPKHLVFGQKSGCRKLFRRAGVSLPAGFEDLRSLDDVVRAVGELKRSKPSVQRVMVKHDDGVSGEGNAQVDLRGVSDDAPLHAIEQRVRNLQLESSALTFDTYFARMERGGIVEERVAAEHVESPSAQLRITPLRRLELISTHDQLLGGPTGQSFLGSRFPADDAYAAAISEQAIRVGELLVEAGVLGRFAIDFLVAKDGDAWTPYAIEVNLRKGGTTHPFLTLQFITDGRYDWRTNEFRTPLGDRKFYVASDHLEAESYRALDHELVFDLAVSRGLHFDHARNRGVVFHMITALGDRGRIGLTAIGDSRDDADALYAGTRAAFDDLAAAELRPRSLPPP